MFNIVRQLDGGEEIWVKELGDVTHAKALVDSLDECWPGVYIVRESATGKEIELSRIEQSPFFSAIPRYVH